MNNLQFYTNHNWVASKTKRPIVQLQIQIQLHITYDPPTQDEPKPKQYDLLYTKESEFMI